MDNKLNLTLPQRMKALGMAGGDDLK